MANRAKQKGYRVERKMVAWLTEMGLKARKVPLSGQTADFKDDLEIATAGSLPTTLRVEVKARKSPPPWLTVKKWLGQADLLFLAEDYEDPLVVMPAELFEALMKEIVRGWDLPH